jgi:hypothetical protein
MLLANIGEATIIPRMLSIRGKRFFWKLDEKKLFYKTHVSRVPLNF